MTHPIPDLAASAPNASQSDRAAFGIRERGLRGEFKAGERLTELVMAATGRKRLHGLR